MNPIIETKNTETPEVKPASPVPAPAPATAVPSQASPAVPAVKTAANETKK